MNRRSPVTKGRGRGAVGMNLGARSADAFIRELSLAGVPADKVSALHGQRLSDRATVPLCGGVFRQEPSPRPSPFMKVRGREISRIVETCSELNAITPSLHRHDGARSIAPPARLNTRTDVPRSRS
jgi:hypothetical protein